MSAMASPGRFTNSGMFAARSDEVNRSRRTGGVSLPFSSMWVRNSWGYGPFTFEGKTSQRLVGDQLCHEVIRAGLYRRRRAGPPAAGMLWEAVAGWGCLELLALPQAIHLPSGENFGK